MSLVILFEMLLSCNVNEVIRAVLNCFTKRFHTHTHTQKHKNAHKRILFAHLRFVLFILLLGWVFLFGCVLFESPQLRSCKYRCAWTELWGHRYLVHLHCRDFSIFLFSFLCAHKKHKKHKTLPREQN